MKPCVSISLNEKLEDVWKKVASDLFVCCNKQYVIAQDYTIKYIEVAHLRKFSLAYPYEKDIYMTQHTQSII